jgi:hypothetical protein
MSTAFKVLLVEDNPEALLGTRQALFRSRAIHGRGNGGKVDCARGSGRSALPGMEGLSLLAKHRGKADVATPLGNSEKNALQQDSKIWAVNQWPLGLGGRTTMNEGDARPDGDQVRFQKNSASDVPPPLRGLAGATP